MANAGRSRSSEKAGEAVPLDQVFGVLEERIEGLVGRVKELAGENVRLKAAAGETAAERDRLAKELDDLREVASRQSEAAEKLSRYEAEREDVRSRVESLLGRLESAGESPSEA